MSIRQISYFIGIVDADCNLTKAAEQLYVSQSALSKMITSFENTEDVTLFYRKNGRLSGVTPVGEMYYARGRQILADYDELMREIREQSLKFEQTVRIGITTFVLSDLCGNLITQLVTGKSDLKIELYESDSVNIREKFLAQQLDLAVVIRPTGFEGAGIKEVTIFKGTLDAFMAASHPLAGRKTLSWDDLADYPISLPSKRAFVHDAIMDKLQREGLDLQKIFTVDSVDFLYESVRPGNIITMLPSVTKKRAEGVAQKKFADPLPWEVVLCMNEADNRPKNRDYVYSKIIDHFQ